MKVIKVCFENCNCLFSQEQQQLVMRRCVQSEPSKGEVWTKFSKDIANWKLKTRHLLPIAANSVSATF